MAARLGLAAIEAAARRAGLVMRGAFHSKQADAVPALATGEEADTLILLGFTGVEGWPAFAASAEISDGKPHPLDRWSARVIGGLAAELGGVALFPFVGPPYQPFQRWAQRAESVYPSPLGLLIHPAFGLWHSYRGAIALADRIDLPAREERASPCDACVDKPCLSTCPASAFSLSGYDVPACAALLETTSGVDCMSGGCLARRACPVGAAHRQGAAQAGFYMSAFRSARRQG